jgi:hypothetical protein
MKMIFLQTILLLLLLHNSISSSAQSWQWGKRGGGLQETSFTSDQEQTYSLITDSDKNVYGLSIVTDIGLNIDNVVKTSFDGGTVPKDIALFSFACNGDYRWSKIIGGSNNEVVHKLGMDAEDNLYVAGRFNSCQEDTEFPPRIDDEFLISQSPQDCRLLFLIKYNQDGVMQWIKRPQAVGISINVSLAQTRTLGLEVDSDGNSYWLLNLPPGTYADGGYSNSTSSNEIVILKYNSSGTFLGAIPLDIQVTGTYGGSLQFQRNPYNGNLYFYARKQNQADTAVIAGNPVTNSLFVSCFDAQGNYLWKIENSNTALFTLSLYNLAFDPDGSLYFGGGISSQNQDNFLGFTIAGIFSPGYVIKTNANASQVLWISHHNKNAMPTGKIVRNGDEIGFTDWCFGTDFAWGTQTLSAPAANQGQSVLLARLDKNTGQCIGLTKIPDNNGFTDSGTAITADASGDYILGGAIGGSLFFNNGQVITNGGSQSDFFVAKYATQICSPLSTTSFNENSIKLYPNPAQEVLYVTVTQPIEYVVYNTLGQELQKGSIANPEEGVDVKALPAGSYILSLRTATGAVERLQFVKR